MREGRRATELSPLSVESFAGAAFADNLAHIYVRAGDNHAAIEQLGRLLAAESPLSAPWVRADPSWDPLREDPRFQRLLERDR